MSNIQPITAGTSAAASSGDPAANPGAVLDRDAFLKLLVAQLKYQDPTNPADTSQMVTQSAQLTMVDRMNDIATALEEAASSDRLSLAGSLVGRDVTFVEEGGGEVTARVASVRFDHGDLTLLAGGFVVPLAAITQVHAPALAVVPPATPAASFIPSSPVVPSTPSDPPA
jgi:flagellar basal-body rod modification protein FlgD